MEKIKMIVLFLVLGVFFIGFTGCVTDAEMASWNISKEADMFRVNRRVVFYNGITGEYMLMVEGRCSINIDTNDRQLELTVKTSENTYKKHYLGLSDNISYFAEQLDSAAVNTYNYKVVFKPSVIVPTIELSR